MQGPGAYRVRAGDFGGQPDRVSVPCLVKVVLRSGDTGGLCPVGLALAAGDDVPGLAEPAHLDLPARDADRAWRPFSRCCLPVSRSRSASDRGKWKMRCGGLSGRAGELEVALGLLNGPAPVRHVLGLAVAVQVLLSVPVSGGLLLGGGADAGEPLAHYRTLPCVRPSRRASSSEARASRRRCGAIRASDSSMVRPICLLSRFGRPVEGSTRLRTIGSEERRLSAARRGRSLRPRCWARTALALASRPRAPWMRCPAARCQALLART